MTNQFLIKKTGYYRTRSGLKACVVALDRPTDYPVIGYVIQPRRCPLMGWNVWGEIFSPDENGESLIKNPWDIVGEWEEKSGELLAWVHEHGDVRFTRPALAKTMEKNKWHRAPWLDPPAQDVKITNPPGSAVSGG